MAKYKVEISRTDYGFVEIEAKDEGDAIDKALDMEMNGEVVWSNSDCEAHSIERIDEGKRW